MHHGQNLQCFLRQTLSLRKHCNSWPRSLKSTFVQRVFMLINLSLVVRKPGLCICENKNAVTARLISAVGFATWIVQSLYFLYTKFQALSYLLWFFTVWLYSLVEQPGLCRTCQKPQDWFSHNEAHFVILLLIFVLCFTVYFTVCQTIIKIHD